MAGVMRQMITRMDDELHARLKEHAAATGRSLNDLVVATLTQALEGGANRQAVRARAQAAGTLVDVTRPKRVHTRDEVIAATRGAGNVASRALAEERDER